LGEDLPGLEEKMLGPEVVSLPWAEGDRRRAAIPKSGRTVEIVLQQHLGVKTLLLEHLGKDLPGWRRS
jgi:hypothetical protein